MAMPAILHLDNYEFTGCGTTIEIVDDTFVAQIICMVFFIKKSKIRYMV